MCIKRTEAKHPARRTSVYLMIVLNDQLVHYCSGPYGRNCLSQSAWSDVSMITVHLRSWAWRPHQRATLLSTYTCCPLSLNKDIYVGTRGGFQTNRNICKWWLPKSLGPQLVWCDAYSTCDNISPHLQVSGSAGCMTPVDHT
jgi:hypothetical protein